MVVLSIGTTRTCRQVIKKRNGVELGGSKVFGNDEREMAATLSRMETKAREQSNFNQNEARQSMASWVANDRRFDGYDPQRLVDRVQHCKSNGAQLDLTDPQLLRGGKPR